jgi:phenylalanyl-tRNA synthetase beta chain
VLDQAVSFEDIKQVVVEQQQPLIKDMYVFDVYQGSALSPGKKAYALSFILEAYDKTLEESTIRSVMHALMDAFQQRLGALIRE